MPRPRTAPSTPRLSEVARHVVIPDGIVTTAWPRVVAKCRDLGVEFDTWQHGIGSAALGKRADGKYAATVGGVVLSIPRQVGKTFLVGMIVIALCLLFPGLTVLWSAHRTRTATKTFQTMKGMTSRAKVKPFMLEPRNTNGEQEIRFRNGSRIMFGAREQGFGRGFDEVDIEVFDEAQILTEKALEDMVPATNQSRQEAGALLFFMGTPPRPSDPGEEFSNRRKAALSGESTDMMFVELSADQDADPDDREQWAKANPSFPVHTPVESMQRMRAQLTDPESFRREGLGIWSDAEGGLFNLSTWRRRCVAETTPGPRVAFGAHVTPDRNFAAVAVGSMRRDGVLHLELVEHQGGVAWLAPWLKAKAREHSAFATVVAGASAAGALAPDLEGVRGFKALGVPDVKKACGGLLDLVSAGRVAVRLTDARLNTALDDAVAAAARSSEKSGEWVFTAAVDVDLSPLYAIALAAHAARRRTPRTEEELLGSAR